MIRVADNRLLINDCIVPQLDINSLHDRLAKSFRACGIRNIWIVDDILIALHSCLEGENSNNSLRRGDPDQINAILIKVLRDNGFSQVAQHFSTSLLEGGLGSLQRKIENALYTLNHPIAPESSPRILQKILSLGYPPNKISPLLIREICLLETTPKETLSEPDNETPHHLQNRMPMEANLADWDWEIMQFKSAGSLFNSIRIDIFPLKLARQLNCKPFMEIIFLSEWQQIISKSSSYLRSCIENLYLNTQEKIDYLSIISHDMDEFLQFCEIDNDSPFLNDLNQSLQSAFSPLIKNSPNFKYRK